MEFIFFISHLNNCIKFLLNSTI